MKYSDAEVLYNVKWCDDGGMFQASYLYNPAAR